MLQCTCCGLRLFVAYLRCASLHFQCPVITAYLFLDGILYSGTQSNLKLSDWGSCGSMPRSIHLPSGGRSTATASVHQLPSLTSNTPSEEPGSQNFRLPNSNPRGQEVQSPVKNQRIECQVIDHGDVTLNAGIHMNCTNLLLKSAFGLWFTIMLS